jgi:hypothetical protein
MGSTGRNGPPIASGQPRGQRSKKQQQRRNHPRSPSVRSPSAISRALLCSVPPPPVDTPDKTPPLSSSRAPTHPAPPRILRSKEATTRHRWPRRWRYPACGAPRGPSASPPVPPLGCRPRSPSPGAASGGPPALPQGGASKPSRRREVRVRFFLLSFPLLFDLKMNRGE